MLSAGDQEAVERFKRFLEIIGQAPRDDQGRYLVGPRTLRYARGEDVHPEGCTGLTARWCPVHGDCTCPVDDQEIDSLRAQAVTMATEPVIIDLASPGCPLHDPSSTHPELDELDLEVLAEEGVH